MSTAVVKQFGLFPPGDFVRLACGELGIVVQRTANARAPIVAVIADAQDSPSTKTVRRDSGQGAHASCPISGGTGRRMASLQIAC